MRARGSAGADKVTALLVVHDGQEWLVECLDALAASTHPLDRLLVVDTSPQEHALEVVERHRGVHARIGAVELLDRRPGADLVVAVRQALRHLAETPVPPSTAGPDLASAIDTTSEHPGRTSAERSDDPGADAAVEWVWVVHDDSAPEPEALSELLRVARASSQVGVIGPKQVLVEDPERLVDFGITTTTTGRRTGGPQLGELDQGQYDDRRDILGVGSSAMLVRREVMEQLGGFDRSARGAEGLDLSWRAQLAGHRVLLAPRARVRERAATLRGARAGQSSRAAAARSRRAFRSVALQRAPWWSAPWLWLRMLLTGIGSALFFLLVKQPGAAGRELADLPALLRLPSRLGARWRFRGHRSVRPRDLAALFASPGDSLRSTLDIARDSVGWQEQHQHFAADGATETGPVAEDAESMTVDRGERRLLASPGLWATLAALAAGTAALRHLLGSGAFTGRTTGLHGGALLPVQATGSDLWQAWSDPWHGAGLGGEGVPGPWMPVIAALGQLVGWLPGAGQASPVGTAIAWIFLLATPAAALAAYAGGRGLTRSRGARGIGALLWAGLPVLAGALAEGRLGPVVAHVLLPLAAGALAAALRRHAPFWSAFQASLLLGLLGIFSPLHLALGSLVAVVAVVLARGSARLRALVVALIPWTLLGGWLLDLWRTPRLLFSGPGALDAREAARPLELALLHPGHQDEISVLLGLPLLAVGALGLLAPGRDRGARVGLSVLAGAGLGLALVAPRLTVGRGAAVLSESGQDLHLWSGTGVQIVSLALWAIALLGTRSLTLRRGVWLPTLGMVLTVAILPLTAFGLRPLPGPLQAATTAPSAAVQDAQRSPAGVRLLELWSQDGAIRYSLAGREPGPVSADLAPVVAGTDEADEAVSRLVSASQTSQTDASRDALARLGVGFVRIRQADAERLGPVLDATPGLNRLNAADGAVTWRVQPEPGAQGPLGPARNRVVDAQGRVLAEVPMTGPHSRSEVDLPAGEGRRLVISEGSGWAEHVRVAVDGQELTALEGQQPTYDLPRAGHLTIEMDHPRRGAQLAQLTALAVVIFLAIPLGRRRRTS